MEKLFILESTPRFYSECPEHGRQREYYVTLRSDVQAGRIKGFRFTLRECAVMEAIEQGILEILEGVEFPQR